MTDFKPDVTRYIRPSIGLHTIPFPRKVLVQAIRDAITMMRKHNEIR